MSIYLRGSYFTHIHHIYLVANMNVSGSDRFQLRLIKKLIISAIMTFVHRIVCISARLTPKKLSLSEQANFPTPDPFVLSNSSTTTLLTSDDFNSRRPSKYGALSPWSSFTDILPPALQYLTAAPRVAFVCSFTGGCTLPSTRSSRLHKRRLLKQRISGSLRSFHDLNRLQTYSTTVLVMLKP